MNARPAVKMLCLLPGAASVAAFSLYPRLVDRAALSRAIEQALGPSWVAASLADQLDALLIIAGIVCSSICWFYVERAGRIVAGRAPRQSHTTELGS